MRKVLLISLAAVIVAGGLAMVLYGAGGAGEDRPRGRPGWGEQRGGPRGPQLTDAQRAKIAELAERPVGKALKAALAAFQAAVKDALKGSIEDEAQLNRAVRMATFRIIMPRTRPAGEGGREGREPSERRRPDRPKKQE